jgi:small conductance mechanosensitive channel
MNTSELFNALIDKLEGWLIMIVRLLPNFALALLVIVVGFFIAKFIRDFSKRQLIRVHLDETISGFLSRIFFLGILIVGLMIALSILNLTGTVTSIMAGLGIIGLALGFAFQETAANFMSGIYITFQQPFAIGDVIETHNGTMGVVKDISLRVTKLQTFDGPIVHVPNRFLFQEELTNYTENGSRRLQVDCGISYGEDLQHVEQVAIEALQDTPGKIPTQDISIHWIEFGDSSINFKINVWLAYSRENQAFIGAKNHVIKSLKAAFDQHDIMIPFPIRTLDFGIKGGVTIKEELKSLNSFQSNGKTAKQHDVNERPGQKGA